MSKHRGHKVRPKQHNQHKPHNPGAVKHPNRVPFVPGSSMTLGEANRSAKQATQVQYGPQLQQLQQTNRNLNAWFPAYQQELSALNNQQQQRYAAASHLVAQQAAQAQQQQAQSNQRLQGQLQAGAAKRGATYSGQPTAQSQQASNIGQDLATGFAAALLGQGAAYSGYTARQQATGAAAQLSARQNVAGQRQEVKREKGAYRQNYLDTLRQNEQKNVLEQQAFGLDVAKEQDLNQRNRFNQKQQNKRTQVSQRHQDRRTQVSQQHQDARTQASIEARKQVEAQKKREQHQADRKKVRQKSRDEHGRLVEIGARWDHYHGTPLFTGSGANRKKIGVAGDKEVTDRLVSEGYSMNEIQVARKIHNDQELTPHEIALARDLGWRVPKKFRQKHPKSQFSPGARRPPGERPT